MINRPLPLLCLALLAVCTGAAARPAAWYWWESRVDGQRACQQTMQGEGWVKVGGPFRDARCSRPLRQP